MWTVMTTHPEWLVEQITSIRDPRDQPASSPTVQCKTLFLATAKLFFSRELYFGAYFDLSFIPSSVTVCRE